MRTSLLVVAGVVLFAASAASAQEPGDGMQAPPLVNAPATDAPTAVPPPPASSVQQPQEAPTPPPPGYVPQGTQKVPYPYSPYGQLQQQEPPAEVGLIVTEAVFGMLTAGGTAALTSLFVVPLFASLGYPVGDLLFIATMATIPLSVAQTEQGMANGSRYYVSDSWPGTLAGLAGEAAAIGIFYLAGGFSTFAPGGLGGAPAGFSVQLTTSLLAFIIANTVLVPAFVTAAINLTKQPRIAALGGMGALMRYDDRHGVRVGIPVPSPIAVQTPSGPKLGLGATLASARF